DQKGQDVCDHPTRHGVTHGAGVLQTSSPDIGIGDEGVRCPHRAEEQGGEDAGLEVSLPGDDAECEREHEREDAESEGTGSVLIEGLEIETETGKKHQVEDPDRSEIEDQVDPSQPSHPEWTKDHPQEDEGQETGYAQL